MRRYRPFGLAAILAIVILACGETDAGETDAGETPEAGPAAAVAPTAGPPPTPTPAPPTPTPTPSPTPTPTPAPVTLSAEEVLDKSTAAMLDVKSVHFDMEINFAQEVQGQRVEIPMRFEGDFQKPDRFRGTMSLTIAFFSVSIEVVQIGDTTYTEDFESGDWVVTSGEDPLFAGPTEVIGAAMSDLVDLRVVGEETLDGVKVIHLEASSPTASISEFEGDFEIGMWVGVDDSLLRQVSTRGEVQLGASDPFFGGLATGNGSVAVTVRLSDFNKPVSIDAPVTVAPTATPTAAETGDYTEDLRRLASDYWTALDSYQVHKALSYLEDAYRSQRERTIVHTDLRRFKGSGVKLGISERSPPRLTGVDAAEMLVELKGPLGVHEIQMRFVAVDGEWKITFAEEVE